MVTRATADRSGVGSNQKSALADEFSNPVVTGSNRSLNDLSNPSRAGFTLIELLVVVSIIGLIATVITVSTSAARVQSRDQKRQADATSLAASLEIYFAEQRTYPQELNLSGSWDDARALKTALYPTYTTSWPSSPNGQDGLFGQGFVYQTNPAGLPAGAKAGSLFMIDVPLEGNGELTNTAINCKNPQVAEYYLTGTYSCDGFVHFRIGPQ